MQDLLETQEFRLPVNEAISLRCRVVSIILREVDTEQRAISARRNHCELISSEGGFCSYFRHHKCNFDQASASLAL